MKKTICLINARGGSKRIKDKNIIKFKSKPLIYWTIKSAQESKIYDHIYVNTDSQNIAKIAKNYGAKVPFLRPKYLSQDNTSSIDSTKFFLNKIGETVDNFDLLQPTSPLRTKRDIVNFHKFINNYNFKSAVSISKLHNSSSSKYVLKNDFSVRKLNQTDSKKNIDIFFLNGSLYYNEISSFLKYGKFIFKYTKGFKMSKKNSIDIDTYKDLELALKFK